MKEDGYASGGDLNDIRFESGGRRGPFAEAEVLGMLDRLLRSGRSRTAEENLKLEETLFVDNQGMRQQLRQALKEALKDCRSTRTFCDSFLVDAHVLGHVKDHKGHLLIDADREVLENMLLDPEAIQRRREALLLILQDDRRRRRRQGDTSVSSTDDEQDTRWVEAQLLGPRDPLPILPHSKT